MSNKKPKNPPMSKNEMLDMQGEKRNNKIYKEQADEHRRDELSVLAARIRGELDAEKLQLVGGDLEQVKRQVDLFLESCEETGTLPSFIGVCRSLGYSRSAVYSFLDNHGKTPIAEYLEIVRDAISDALDAAALQNSVNPIVSIFIQKSIHQRVDKHELTIIPPSNPLGDITDESVLIERYQDSLPELNE